MSECKIPPRGWHCTRGSGHLGSCVAYRFQRVAVGFDWPIRYWGFHFRHEWYDGPYWSLAIGPLGVVWSPYGLPSIFCKDEEKS